MSNNLTNINTALSTSYNSALADLERLSQSSSTISTTAAPTTTTIAAEIQLLEQQLMRTLANDEIGLNQYQNPFSTAATNQYAPSLLSSLYLQEEQQQLQHEQQEFKQEVLSLELMSYLAHEAAQSTSASTSASTSTHSTIVSPTSSSGSSPAHVHDHHQPQASAPAASSTSTSTIATKVFDNI